jgi:hypothetical protein
VEAVVQEKIMDCLVAPVVAAEIEMLVLKQAEEPETPRLFHRLKVVMAALERQLNMVAQVEAVERLLLEARRRVALVALVAMAQHHLFLA